jgi:hypothetical protein
MSEHIITIDLKGLGLSEEQFQDVQASLHQATLTQIAKLPPFKVDGIGIRPTFGPRGSGGPIINGIVVDRLRAAAGGR